MKFNVDIFFKILAKENFKDLVNQMPILEKSETLFSYALAKGFGYNKKGLWYDFLYETDDSEPYNLSEKFKYIDKKLVYKPLVKIRGGDEDWNSFFEIGFLKSKKSKYSFIVYNNFISDYSESPKVIKIFKNNNIPTFGALKKYVTKIIKRVNFGPTRQKIASLGVWKNKVFINKKWLRLDDEKKSK